MRFANPRCRAKGGGVESTFSFKSPTTTCPTAFQRKSAQGVLIAGSLTNEHGVVRRRGGTFNVTIVCIRIAHSNGSDGGKTYPVPPPTVSTRSSTELTNSFRSSTDVILPIIDCIGVLGRCREQITHDPRDGVRCVDGSLERRPSE